MRTDALHSGALRGRRIMAYGAQADICGMTLHLLANATANEYISMWMMHGILGKAIGYERSDH